jgi:hypothetical protein
VRSPRKGIAAISRDLDLTETAVRDGCSVLTSTEARAMD